MAHVILRAPLSERCGGKEHHLEGTTVGAILRALERAHPDVAGWTLDERGALRPHVNVFVNGAAGNEDTAVSSGDRVHVLPSITGG